MRPPPQHGPASDSWPGDRGGHTRPSGGDAAASFSDDEDEAEITAWGYPAYGSRPYEGLAQSQGHSPSAGSPQSGGPGPSPAYPQSGAHGPPPGHARETQRDPGTDPLGHFAPPQPSGRPYADSPYAEPSPGDSLGGQTRDPLASPYERPAPRRPAAWEQDAPSTTGGTYWDKAWDKAPAPGTHDPLGAPPAPPAPPQSTDPYGTATSSGADPFDHFSARGGTDPHGRAAPWSGTDAFGRASFPGDGHDPLGPVSPRGGTDPLGRPSQPGGADPLSGLPVGTDSFGRPNPPAGTDPFGRPAPSGSTDTFSGTDVFGGTDPFGGTDAFGRTDAFGGTDAFGRTGVSRSAGIEPFGQTPRTDGTDPLGQIPQTGNIDPVGPPSALSGTDHFGRIAPPDGTDHFGRIAPPGGTDHFGQASFPGVTDPFARPNPPAGTDPFGRTGSGHGGGTDPFGQGPHGGTPPQPHTPGGQWPGPTDHVDHLSPGGVPLPRPTDRHMTNPHGVDTQHMGLHATRPQGVPHSIPPGVPPGVESAPPERTTSVQIPERTGMPPRGGAILTAVTETGIRARTAAAAPAQGARAPRKREPYLDNVKFILIWLVVAGHALVPTLDAHSGKSAYIFIFAFHMPLFVMISGYLSRNFWNSNAKTNKLVDTFLIPYVIVEVGYALLRLATGQKWSLTIMDPAWLNWYLLALLLWRLSTPVWKRMRYPFLVSVVIYMLAGFSAISGDFSMDRFFGLLPFFVLGLLLQPKHFEMLNRGWVKILAAVTLVGGAGVAILAAPHMSVRPMYFKYGFEDLGLTWLPGLGMRAALLIGSMALSFAVLALAPRGETWYTDLGTRTLYAYLLHGIPVMIGKETGLLNLPWLHGPLGVIAISTASLLLAVILCLPITRTAFKWLLEPRLVWLYRRPSR
ncbi:acyltransferase family protein [Sinosporangium album]|uniref:acyltransferase family protein n=1 Tax=Sinosporangium album TaxID=504805 RepID=UPI000B825582|nr:acyltransferase family protein [Sinosporangium album]